MQLHKNFVPPSPPIIDISGLSQEQREIARSVEDNLRDLSTSAKSVAAAVALFQFCRKQPVSPDSLFQEWLFLAARDGAMSIRNFGVAISTVRSLVGRVPIWLGGVDTKGLKIAERTFNQAFPFAHKLRHSVAHPEFHSELKKKMGIDGSYEGLGYKIENSSNISIQLGLYNNTFHSTFEGQLVQYDLTEQTISVLIDVTKECFHAFSKLDRFSASFQRR
jgi:hypothetical protein